MSTIQYDGSTYRGTADDEYGVFTHKRGTVFAGSHANGSARVGVNTKTSGTLRFVECDADGQYDGRYLRCDADGDTWYRLMEHGGVPKEQAVLCADGTCTYDNKKCSADFPPFVQLQAKVLPIKARPPLLSHSRPYPEFAPTHPAPIAPQSAML